MANKRGRKRKPGERYPSGDLKPATAPALWARIRGVLGEFDPIARTELTRLSFADVLSAAQTQAGFYIGDIYRQYFSQKDRQSTPHRRKCFQKIESRLYSRQPLLFIAKDFRVEEWRNIENEVEALPQTLRGAVLDLCLFNEPINPVIYRELRVFLDRIARICGKDWARYQPRELRFPKPVRSTKVTIKSNDEDVDVTVFEKILLRLRPDLNAKEVSDVRDMLLAIRDREDFRQAKLANMKPR